MKKLITISIILTLLLSGCAGKPNQTQQPQQVQQRDDEDEMGWFADEVLDMDDWGEKKKYKIETKVSKPPSTKPLVGTKSTAKPKASKKTK